MLRYSIAFPLLCSHFSRCVHPMCPEEVGSAARGGGCGGTEAPWHAGGGRWQSGTVGDMALGQPRPRAARLRGVVAASWPSRRCSPSAVPPAPGRGAGAVQQVPGGDGPAGQQLHHGRLRRAPQPQRAGGELRTPEYQGLEGTLKDHPAQSPCRSRDTRIRSHRNASGRVLGDSREGDPTAPPGSLFRALPPSPCTSLVSFLSRTSRVPACTRCPSSCRWVPPSRAWPRPPAARPSHNYKR